MLPRYERQLYDCIKQSNKLNLMLRKIINVAVYVVKIICCVVCHCLTYIIRHNEFSYVPEISSVPHQHKNVFDHLLTLYTLTWPEYFDLKKCLTAILHYNCFIIAVFLFNNQNYITFKSQISFLTIKFKIVWTVIYSVLFTMILHYTCAMTYQV